MDRFSVIINIIKRMLVIRILLGVPIAACGGRGDSKSHLIGSWRGGLYLPPEDHLGF
jgi:predicted small lipoprotein YifL